MMINDVYISERFIKIVSLHILKNYHTSYYYNTPLILGIHGPSGEGKTFQCHKVLERLNVEPFLISGGELESDHAGQPAELLRTTYRKAGLFISNTQNNKSFAVLLINDFDTGVGNWGENVQYTENRQLLFSEFMHLADYPNMVHNQPTKRVPIIITGNDFTKLYHPLSRLGRMIAFAWIPSFEEKVSIIDKIFPGIKRKDCEKLLTKLGEGNKTLPIAFYTHLKSSLDDEYLWQQILINGINNFDNLLNINGTQNIKHYKIEDLIEMGKKLKSLTSYINHLQEGK